MTRATYGGVISWGVCAAGLGVGIGLIVVGFTALGLLAVVLGGCVPAFYENRHELMRQPEPPRKVVPFVKRERPLRSHRVVPFDGGQGAA